MTSPHHSGLQNTLIIVTSDNGMPFPRAKATLYESGTRVPQAIRSLQPGILAILRPTDPNTFAVKGALQHR